MRYSEIQISDIKAKLAHFDINRREAHAILSCTVSTSNARTQIAELSDATNKLSLQLGMRPVFKRYLLSDATNQCQFLPERDECARSIIQQSPLDGSKATVLAIFQDHSTFKEQGKGVWMDDSGRIWAGDNDELPPADSRQMTMNYLAEFSRVLSLSGGTLEDHCVRTWFFVRDVDNNYSGVVDGRNDIFANHRLTTETHFIASTGIAGQSPDPSRLVVFNAYADISLHKSQIKFLHGKTHLNPTYEYGVAFERGTAVDYGDRRHVYISGTASIDHKGNIVAPGDITAQTERMLENIGVLLTEGSCTWGDVAHMLVYLRDIADYQIVSSLMNRRFPRIPIAIVLAPVCRPGWLIEAECLAVKQTINSGYAPF